MPSVYSTKNRSHKGIFLGLFFFISFKRWFVIDALFFSTLCSTSSRWQQAVTEFQCFNPLTIVFFPIKYHLYGFFGAKAFSNYSRFFHFLFAVHCKYCRFWWDIWQNSNTYGTKSPYSGPSNLLPSQKQSRGVIIIHGNNWSIICRKENINIRLVNFCSGSLLSVVKDRGCQNGQVD